MCRNWMLNPYKGLIESRLAGQKWDGRPLLCVTSMSLISVDCCRTSHYHLFFSGRSSIFFLGAERWFGIAFIIYHRWRFRRGRTMMRLRMKIPVKLSYPTTQVEASPIPSSLIDVLSNHTVDCRLRPSLCPWKLFYQIENISFRKSLLRAVRSLHGAVIITTYRALFSGTRKLTNSQQYYHTKKASVIVRRTGKGSNSISGRRLWAHLFLLILQWPLSLQSFILL